MEYNEKKSVVIPVKNEADKIALCPEAVLNQSVEPQEVIAMTGYSKAKTMVYTKAEFMAFTDDECILGEA